jgi:hypothetical protein
MAGSMSVLSAAKRWIWCERGTSLGLPGQCGLQDRRDRRHDVDALHVAIADHGILLAGQLDEERHRHDVGQCFPIDALERPPRSEAHAVIAGDDNERLVVEPLGFEPAGDLPDDRVHVLQLQQVLPVRLHDGPQFMSPPARALQAVERRAVRELLTRSQIHVRLVRKKRVEEVKGGLRIGSADALDEPARTLATVRVACANPSPLPVLSLNEVLPVLRQRRQEPPQIRGQRRMQVDDGGIEG